MFRSYIDKEKEESLRDYSSFSDNEDIEEEKLEEIESSPCASFLNKQAQVRKEKRKYFGLKAIKINYI